MKSYSGKLFYFSAVLLVIVLVSFSVQFFFQQISFNHSKFSIKTYIDMRKIKEALLSDIKKDIEASDNNTPDSYKVTRAPYHIYNIRNKNSLKTVYDILKKSKIDNIEHLEFKESLATISLPSVDAVPHGNLLIFPKFNKAFNNSGFALCLKKKDDETLGSLLQKIRTEQK